MLTLPQLASEINKKHEHRFGLPKMNLDDLLEIGKMLAEAKAQVKHGQWIAWIKDKLKNIGRREVQNYMKIFTHSDKVLEAAKRQRVAHLTLREALAIAGAPEGSVAVAKKNKEKANTISLNLDDLVSAAEKLYGALCTNPAHMWRFCDAWNKRVAKTTDQPNLKLLVS